MKKYVFKPYNTNFPLLFSQEKERILAHLPQAVIIEHIGSTAVPYLGGKGIIDIAMGVPRGPLDVVIEPLKKLGYDHRIKWSTLERLYFVADLPDPEEGIRRYHIHVMPYQNAEWNDMIHFRDYLRNHPEEAERYAHIKQQAAVNAEGEGMKYRESKQPFFDQILKKDRS